MLYHVTHTTRYTYEAAVLQCFNEARLTPRALSSQQVRESGIVVEPAPPSFERHNDYFGNGVTTFTVFEKHDRFIATANSIVEVQPEAHENIPLIGWEEARDLIAAPADAASLEAFEFI